MVGYLRGISIIYESYICHISAIYQPYISHISVIFQSYISNIRSCIAGHYGFKSSYGANNWYWGNKYSTVFFHEIQSHLVTNPARKYCQLDSELRSNKMFVDGRKFENRNFPRFQQVNLFKNMSPRFCSKLVFQALAAVMLTASEDGETFKTLPAKIASKFGLSSRVADDLFYSRIVGKYEQIHIHRVHNFELKELTISHSNASQFHTQVPDHLCQRGRSGVSSAYACKQEQGEMGEQPQNLTLFLNPLLSYVTIQGAHPTSYLLAVLSLFAPGVDLLGKCVLQLVQTLLSNQTGARRPGQLWTTFWPSTGTGLG